MGWIGNACMTAAVMVAVLPPRTIAQPSGAPRAAVPGDAAVATKAENRGVRPAGLTAQQRMRVDTSVDRALAWIASTQGSDGSFPTQRPGQPAVTGLCLLAFLSRGHLPDAEPYGRHIKAGTDFVMSCRNSNGLISRYRSGTPGIYNHAISGLALSELCGMTDPFTSSRIRTVLGPAVEFTCRHQKFRKRWAVDEGGWRYLQRFGSIDDSDLSVTSWQLLFLRSAKNAGFDVPPKVIDDGIAYVRRCFDEQQRTFVYGLRGENRRPNRGMAGAGILSLSLGGLHGTEEAQVTGKWILRHPFDRYNVQVGTRFDAFHYGAFYCSHAMFQLGEEYWGPFFTTLTRTLVENQRPDGSWDRESNRDGRYGNVYSSALAVLALSPPYQLLPVFQR